MSRRVQPAAPSPCSACPWRLTNHGQPHPHGWYTKANRARLWSKLRRGESMTCHPTDPENPVPDGVPTVSTDCTTLECAGALILQQREVAIFQEHCHVADAEGKKDGLKRYRAARPKGMTREGIAAIFGRAMFGGTLLGGAKMPTPDLNQEVGHDGLDWGA